MMNVNLLKYKGMKFYLLLMFTVLSGTKLSFAQETNVILPLSEKQQQIALIASYTAQGDLKGLKKELVKGLTVGLTVNEVKEVLVHCYAYCGFPRSIRGLQTFISVLDERKAQGIVDVQGKEASKIPNDTTKYEQGKQNLERLAQMPLGGTKPTYQQFSPEIEVFLKEHLFADLFNRDVLSFQQRELVTVSVLISLGDLEPMLRAHMGLAFKQGITQNQMATLITQLKPHVKRRKIRLAQKVLN